MPPRAWNAKRERQYEHIKDSREEHGRQDAEEIAARTVNKMTKFQLPRAVDQ